MRDLLSRFPETIVGAPVMLFAGPDFEDTASSWPACLELPFPTPDMGPPCEDLHFLGWVPADTQLPLRQPFRPEDHVIQVPWLRPTGVVALFRTHPGLFDQDTVELPNMWWGSLFRSVQGNIHLSAKLLLPYPDALEAARTMQAYIRGQSVPDKGLFLSDAAWSFARDEATLFQETCRHLFKNELG